MFRRILIGLSILNAAIIHILAFKTDFKMLWLSLLIAVGTYAFLIICYVIFIYVLSLFVSLKKEYKKVNKFYEKVLLLTMQLLLDVLHVKIEFKGKEKLPPYFMFVYNHTSNFDGFVQTVAMKERRLVHISKPELFKLPLVGRMIYRAGYIAIDRNSARNAMKSIIKAGNVLSNEEASIVISPEGTRNKSGKGLLEFKDGCFHIAMKGKKPIVVARMYGLNEIKHNFPFKRSKVTIEVLEVLPVENFEGKSAVEISTYCRNVLLKTFED